MTPSRLVPELERFFRVEAPLTPGDTVVVAFSGGPDSTALLWGLAQLRQALEIELRAAHLDHGLDSESGKRAEAAAQLCAQLGVPSHGARAAVAAARHSGESQEAAARRLRYDFLEGLRSELGARCVATGHHRDDQIETVVLRLAFGSGLAGLGGIAPVRGNLVRPLLALPRAELAAAVSAAGLEPVSDPANLDLALPRNRIRHLLLPRLAERDPAAPAAAFGVAAAARGAWRALERRLSAALTVAAEPVGASLDLVALRALPEALWSPSLALLHRTAGLPYPPRASAMRELGRRLRGDASVGCDCGSGWRWSECDGLLVVAPVSQRGRSEPPPPFAYTLAVPGEIDLPEISTRFRLRRDRVAPWMLRGSTRRAALALALEPGEHVTVRNRRPGDRIQPLGCGYRRKLKDVLIDRGMARAERDRLPLLCVGDRGERIVWVPGVTIDHECRLQGHETAWIAELERVE